MSDGIINLGEYLRRREGGEQPSGSTFALWGADGERSRFALPLWRSIYLASGERGAIVWQIDPAGDLRPFVVLDLAQDPARRDFPPSAVAGLQGEEAPALSEAVRGSLAVHLGERNGKRWFLVVLGSPERMKGLQGRDREDILFLAGECAGLLFLRDFATGAGRGD